MGPVVVATCCSACHGGGEWSEGLGCRVTSVYHRLEWSDGVPRAHVQVPVALRTCSRASKDTGVWNVRSSSTTSTTIDLGHYLHVGHVACCFVVFVPVEVASREISHAYLFVRRRFGCRIYLWKGFSSTIVVEVVGIRTTAAVFVVGNLAKKDVCGSHLQEGFPCCCDTGVRRATGQ